MFLLRVLIFYWEIRGDSSFFRHLVFWLFRWIFFFFFATIACGVILYTTLLFFVVVAFFIEGCVML